MYLIAEIGTNHNGSENTAIKLVRAAVEAGASAVKMNYWQTDLLTSKTSSWYERCKALELDYQTLVNCAGICYENDVNFIIAPWAAELVEDSAVISDKLKISSGELTNHKLLRSCRKTEKQTILSIGMATDNEILEAYHILNPQIMMHCVSLYPCPADKANLGRIKWLKENYPAQIGYSSHVVGETDKIAAYTTGADPIEVHFNINGNVCVDDQFSFRPEDVRRVIYICNEIDTLFKEARVADWAMRNKLRRGKSGLRE